MERKKAEDKLSRINECFLHFGTDATENINRLVTICGELLGATCALYNRLEKDMLYTKGQWNLPGDYNPIDKAEGHICYDLIRNSTSNIRVIRDLANTKYAETDPNVKQYNLKTYIGMPVKFGRINIGSLCVVYQKDFVPDESDKNIMSIISSAIAIEEERMQAENAMRESQQRYQSLFEDSPISLWEEDFSAIKMRLDLLRKEGVKDFRSYLDKHPEFVAECVTLLKVIDVNKAALELHGAKHKREFWYGLSSTFVEESYSAIKEQLITISEGKTSFECETAIQTFFGTRKDIHLKWSVVPGHEEMYSRLLVSIMDITDRKKAEKEVKNSEDKFRNLAESSPNMIFINFKGKVSYVNKACVEIMGFTKDEFYSPNFDFMSLVCPEHKGPVEDVFNRYMQKKRIEWYDCTLITKRGKKIDVLISLAVINYNGGKAVLGVATDITEYNRTARELLEERDKVKMYLDLVGSIVIALDENGKVTLINKKGLEMLGCTTRGVIGKNWFDKFIPKKIRKELLGYFKEIISGKMKRFEYIKNAILTKKGEEKMVSWHNTLLKDADGRVKGTLSAGIDITEHLESEGKRKILDKELSKSNKRLRQLVLRDPHTGLYNHRYLADAIESEFSRARRYAQMLSVTMLDIDYFISINDLYRHEFGYIVLKQFAKQLRKMVRQYDIVIRLGGEEFLIISPGTDKATAVNLAERFLDAINIYRFGNKKHAVKLTLSIAVAAYPEDKVYRGMGLVNLAEKILNRAKEEGGNRICLSEDMSKKEVPVKKLSEDNDIKFLRNKIDKLNKRSKQGIVESIFAFAKTIELKDHYTGEHVERTVHYATEIAKRLGLPKHEIELIRQASMLHDLGKVGISEKLLLKKAKLTKREFSEIKKHPQIGADILRPIQFLHDIIPLIFYHHERWDGKGYPSGLKGEEIPVGARIIALADAYQALTSDRPYRKAYNKVEVTKILKNESGVKYDPNVINAFLKILKKE